LRQIAKGWKSRQSPLTKSQQSQYLRNIIKILDHDSFSKYLTKFGHILCDFCDCQDCQILPKPLPGPKMSGVWKEFLSSQNENYFFQDHTINFFYRHNGRFFIKYLGFSKMDKNKCPNFKTKKLFHFRKSIKSLHV